MLKHALVAALVLGLTAPLAQADLITFDEVAIGTPVDGMTIGKVTFNFSSVDATVTMTGPGTTLFKDPPNIEGDAFGTLTLTFAIPVTNLSYGFALSTSVPIDPGTSMDLFADNGAFIGTFTELALDHGVVVFVEGQMSVAPVTPIKTAVITFANTDNGRFTLDNLTFRNIPGPATFALFGLAGFMGTRRRRK